MTTIQDAINNANSLKELHPIVMGSVTDISFLGRCYIINPNYDGVSDIDQLAKRLMDIIKKDPEFSETERELGKQADRTITRLYNDSDRIYFRKNILTQLFALIQGAFNYLSQKNTHAPISWYWPIQGGCHLLSCYTENQYQQAFGCPPTGRPECKMGGISRWSAYRPPRPSIENDSFFMYTPPNPILSRDARIIWFPA